MTELPPGLEKISALAERLSSGAANDFERLERIIAFVDQQTLFDPYQPDSFTSSASLDEFLFQDKPGSVIDHATATVMLARASGLPSRLAMGYLPGVRDPLTGTYRVRESDEHAWAEVYFRRNGWVPFDSAPRTEHLFEDHSTTGVGRVFEANIGEGVYGSLRDGPQVAFETLAGALEGPVLLIVGSSIFFIVLVLRWFQKHARNSSDRNRRLYLSYAAISGGGRKELRKLYAEVERALRRNFGRKREVWQTVGRYNFSAAGPDSEVGQQVSWFTQAIWQTAYRTGELPSELVSEARSRLVHLKSALRASRRKPMNEFDA